MQYIQTENIVTLWHTKSYRKLTNSCVHIHMSPYAYH